MVKGLELFKERFAGLEKSYVLIGGTAATLVMEEAGLSFRVTKDLDIVLSIEALDDEFVKTLWAFIESGNYENRQRSTGRKLFYRFYAPKVPGYPEMLELFSRIPDALSLGVDAVLTPLPMGTDAASLSAILLEHAYYDFIHAGKRIIGDLPTIGPDRLIPLKAKAWLDLRARRIAGETIDEHDVRKHRNDILRIYRVIDPSVRVETPAEIKTDLKAAMSALSAEPDIHLKALGLRTVTLEEIIGTLGYIYSLDNPMK